MHKMPASTCNSEANTFSTPEAVETGVVLGVYGIEDWVESNIFKDFYLNEINICQKTGTWLVENGFDLRDFASVKFKKYMFYSADTVSGYFEDGLIKIYHGRNKIEVELIGTESFVQLWLESFNENYSKAENLIKWVYNAKGDDISVPLNFRPAIRTAYPWIDESYADINDYIDEYINSEASVLILIGPPGTGKTTFIKNLIHRSKADAKVAYDPSVILADGFFAGFIEDESRFLIMEDADDFLRARDDGNTMMHKFLNVSDGLVSASDKKIVFSTNLPSIHDIDEALMRPGRCFEVLEFRNLFRDEAQKVLDEVGSTAVLPDGNTISLAQIFSINPTRKSFVRRKIGFSS